MNGGFSELTQRREYNPRLAKRVMGIKSDLDACPFSWGLEVDEHPGEIGYLFDAITEETMEILGYHSVSADQLKQLLKDPAMRKYPRQIIDAAESCRDRELKPLLEDIAVNEFECSTRRDAIFALRKLGADDSCFMRILENVRKKSLTSVDYESDHETMYWALYHLVLEREVKCLDKYLIEEAEFYLYQLRFFQGKINNYYSYLREQLPDESADARYFHEIQEHSFDPNSPYQLDFGRLRAFLQLEMVLGLLHVSNPILLRPLAEKLKDDSSYFVAKAGRNALVGAYSVHHLGEKYCICYCAHADIDDADIKDLNEHRIPGAKKPIFLLNESQAQFVEAVIKDKDYHLQKLDRAIQALLKDPEADLEPFLFHFYTPRGTIGPDFF